jgi:putative phosphoesterase
MKIVVFSDSHNDTETMFKVVEKINPDMVIHLGDHLPDAFELQKTFEEIPMEFVKGNTDSTYDYKTEKVISANETKIFISHGDSYNVGEGLERIIQKGRDTLSKLVLFGHTHKPYLNNTGEIIIMNPGRIGRKSSKQINATFGIVELIEHNVNCSILEFNSLIKSE